jgi:hypothetical protein
MRTHPNTGQKSILSAITHKFNISGHMFIRIFLFLWYLELGPKICPHLSVTACVVCRLRGPTESEDRIIVNDELERMWKEVVMTYLKVPSTYFIGKSEEKT